MFPPVSSYQPSTVPHRDRLDLAEMVQPLEPLLAAVAGVLDPAEGQLDAAAGAVIVDEDLPGLERAGEPHLPAAVARPGARDQPVGRAVGDADPLGLVAEADRAEYRAEDLLLRKEVVGRHVADQRRLDIEPRGRRVRRDPAFGED